MTTTREYYREARELLWPILKYRVSRAQSLREQMFALAAEEQKAAKRLLRIPTGEAPATLVRHFEAWAKHLQGAPEIVESADAVGLLDSGEDTGEEMEESREPGLVRRAVGVFVTVFAQEAFGVRPRSSVTSESRVSTRAFAAHQKRAKKYYDERARLEALTERAGADHVPDFRAGDYVWMCRWSEKEERLPKESLMGPTKGDVAEQLRLLPGGAQLSVVEFYPRSDEYLSVFGAVDEGFALRYDETELDRTMESTEENFSLEDAVVHVERFLDAPDDWEALTDWQVRE